MKNLYYSALWFHRLFADVSSFFYASFISCTFSIYWLCSFSYWMTCMCATYLSKYCNSFYMCVLLFSVSLVHNLLYISFNLNSSLPLYYQYFLSFFVLCSGWFCLLFLWINKMNRKRMKKTDMCEYMWML